MGILILFAMLFCHIVDDYYLQGWLANGKQKSWWEKNAPSAKYKKDYLMALFMHAFSWSFMVHIPLIIFSGASGWIIGASIVINCIIHAVVDDQKANRGTINLIQDQSIHMIQLAITFILFAWVF